MMSKTKSQFGVVLPLTLIIVAVLTLMAGIALTKTNLLVDDARQSKARWEAKRAIHSAEQRVQFAMMVGIQHPGAFQLADTQLRTDGTPTKLSNDVWVSIQDQAGLLSLRFVRKDLLRQLFRSYINEPGASNLVNAIIHYQTESMDASSQRNTVVRQALFRSLDELMLIPGITPEWFNGKRNLNLEGNPWTSIPTPLREYGLRDFLAISGSENVNLAAVPNEMLKRVFSLNQQDIDRIERLKERGDWNGVVSSFNALGLSLSATLQSVPSSFYIIRYQYGSVQARGDYQVRSTTLPPRKRSWYFPDNYRYFDIPKQ